MWGFAILCLFAYVVWCVFKSLVRGFVLFLFGRPKRALERQTVTVVVRRAPRE